MHQWTVPVPVNQAMQALQCLAPIHRGLLLAFDWPPGEPREMSLEPSRAFRRREVDEGIKETSSRRDVRRQIDKVVASSEALSVKKSL